MILNLHHEIRTCAWNVTYHMCNHTDFIICVIIPKLIHLQLTLQPVLKLHCHVFSSLEYPSVVTYCSCLHAADLDQRVCYLE